MFLRIGAVVAAAVLTVVVVGHRVGSHSTYESTFFKMDAFEHRRGKLLIKTN